MFSASFLNSKQKKTQTEKRIENMILEKDKKFARLLSYIFN